MDNVVNWKLEDWCDHAAFEAMIEVVGSAQIGPYVEGRRRGAGSPGGCAERRPAGSLRDLR